MPEKTQAQLQALKNGYLVYRQLMTLPLAGKFGRMSLDMITAANAIESKLAVRGKIAPSALPTAAEDMYEELFGRDGRIPPNKMIDLAKADQKTANEAKARKALNNFLQSANGSQGAVELKEELEMLASYCVSKSLGVKWIPGPLKKIDRAIGKTKDDYGWAYGLNKDLVRGTLACDSEANLSTVAALVQDTCKNEFAIRLIKEEHTKAVADGGKSTTGYSGWNFVVLFREHPAFGAEIQANTFNLMYGKMTKHEFCLQLKVSEEEYLRRQSELRFPGGLGHALYDIQDPRTLSTKEEADAARALACDYNDGCRGKFRGFMTLKKLNETIMGFASKLSSVEATEHWKQACFGSGWKPLQDQAHAKPKWR
jgi:hypothetical protein